VYLLVVDAAAGSLGGLPRPALVRIGSARGKGFASSLASSSSPGSIRPLRTAGVPRIVMEILGHPRIWWTMNTYSHDGPGGEAG
jgi:hypothetical protein